MKTLLPLVLSMVAVAREATGQDAQCTRERAAMVETIRAYGRVRRQCFGTAGPVGKGPGGHGANETPSVHP
jgi:protein-L-isoaspartate(D-aspartate) O-methyltransferase